MNNEKYLQMHYHYLLFFFYLFKFRKFCNLLIFKTSPYPLQRGNEIVYDFQGVIERIFSRLIDNFYLFQRIYSPSRRGQGGGFLCNMLIINQL